MTYVNDAFFEHMESQHLMLTYDDVGIASAASDFGPDEVDLTSKFTTNVGLKLPIVSAAMDTVTESDMAIAMAMSGGIGVVHGALSIERQKEEVRRVKKKLHGFIDDPRTISPDATLSEVDSECRDKDWDFRTLPVVDSNGKFVGLVSQNTFDFSTSDWSQPISDVMVPAEKVISASGTVSIKEAHELMREHKVKMLPVLEEDASVAGLYVWKDVDGLMFGDNSLYNLDDANRLIVAAAVPTDKEALERVQEMGHHLDAVVIDSARGDSKYAFQTLALLKENFPELDVMVGNITNPASGVRLAEMGADGLKIGQGPGSICTTRMETGIGHPQVSAVARCVKALREAGYGHVPVCADGGARNPRDISIAMVAGAHSIMLGSMLAGTSETPGEEIAGEKAYRGMGSAEALRDNLSSRKRYATVAGVKPLPEGIATSVAFRGSVATLLQRYEQSLRSSMSYCGSETIEYHRSQVELYQVTAAGMREAMPHINW